MTMKNKVIDFLNTVFTPEQVTQTEKYLENLPDAPTIVITVENGIADFQFLPLGPKTVNILLIDVDGFGVGEEVSVNRVDIGKI